ncbi:CheA signal transduction histidine kinase [Desulfovibrio sp. X2]|uniref:chemotaxis protein CheA n=1 Tax=Desulfovibrio sp. X2 TaxID=941449 RepID=UPI000358B1E3|nr:chemotaxis protein CheA [Desulfovibrio sp. X2]EPR37302.1 CheA signal transduction histidine kinase [Desulfovibrio sp. X2]
MSQDFMDPEIFADFIVEAKEHLETIEPTLIELEKAPDNLGLLNDIFRPMHSLKGASGFLGLNKINGLAHKAENILDELRNANLSVTTEIMDVILSATDALRTMIDSLDATGAEGDTDVKPIVAHIEALLAGGGTTAQAAAPAAPAPEETATEAPALAEEGAAPSAASSAAQSAAGAADVRLPALPPFESETYKLTVIGEGHLADFLEEAREIVENLNSALVELEKDPEGGGELVNDVFRYFHNLKGNSGIIGYKELNGLTHEAETLLNKVRKGELTPSQPMIDLLLAAVDAIDELISAIDAKKAEVTTHDTRRVQLRLQAASEHGVFVTDEATAQGEDEGGAPVLPVAETAPVPEAEMPLGAAAEGFDPEDVQIFVQANLQQIDNIALALSTLRKDSDNKDYVDGLFRCLVTVQNSAGYMGFEEINVTAERTAGLVDQARKSDLDFSLMLDILDQECSILEDMVRAKIKDLTGHEAMTPNEAAEAQAAAPAAAPAPEAAPAAPAPEKKAELKEKAAAKSAPAQDKAEAPAPKPAVQAAAPAAAAAPKAAPKPAAKSASDEQAQAKAAAAAKSSSTIRVDHEKLDHLMNLIGELIINRNRFAMLARSLEEGHMDAQEIAQNLIETTDAMNRISDDLQDTIMNVRMVPVGTVFSRFPRLVRDISRKTGKNVELIMEGEDTELDKSVVEVIGDPLVHMIRNSMDHGVEGEEERRAAGKEPVGHVYLRAYHKGNSVAIEVEDDGRGIDPQKMRQVAIRKGVITSEQAAAMDDREAMELIFAPGFSSAEQVTDISGRGVGMDVVRSNIKNLKGNVAVSSEVGKGTKIALSLPLTLAIIDALMVKVGPQTFAIPLDAVSETTKIEARRLTDVNKRKALELRGEVIGVVELSEMLGLDNRPEKLDILPMVIIQDNERRLGVVVDKLLERQEIVIKPLGTYLSDFELPGISGATIMGDGSVVLILDPHEVYGLAAQTAR